MSIPFVHASPAATAAPSINGYVAGPEALACSYNPPPFLAGHIETHGLRGIKAIPEVIEEYAGDVENLVRSRPIWRNTLFAHLKGVMSGVAHLNPRCSRLIRAREKMLADPTVRELLARQSRWELSALVAAAAIELEMPILGYNKFYRAYAEHHPIPAGVRDPRDGVWIVPPTA